MPSFDIVCELNKHQVANAVDQANREVGNRFDFKGIDASFELKDTDITMKAEADFQLKQMLEVLRNKLAKREVDLKHIDLQDPVIQGKTATQVVKLQVGIPQDKAKSIVKLIKDQKMKVQSSIQGDQVRVTGKKRDDLQDVIALLKEKVTDLPLQFDNFRD